MLDGDKKIMLVTMNYYITVNKIYLYNYNDKITRIIKSKKKLIYKISK